MKRALPLLVIVLVIAVFLATLGLVWAQSRAAPDQVQTDTPSITDIVLKTVASGAIVPRNEVAIKPQVSGLVKTLAVEPGDIVARGDLLAVIQVVPDSAQLSNARSGLAQARIRLQEAEMELSRIRGLSEKGAISAVTLERAQTDWALAREGARSAQDNLSIISEGAARSAGARGGVPSDTSPGGVVPTEVRSTVSGMVLSVPVKLGQSVIEAGPFNEGTTIAEVADMQDLIFLGTVDESEVGRIHTGLPLDIRIGAYPERSFTGTLEYIAPKGESVAGAVLFEIKAAMEIEEGQPFVRAGVSANADIVLDRRQQVLSISEATLIFEDGATLVEVQVSEGVFERRPVTLGLSDGIQIEVLDGLEPEAVLKRQ